MNPFLLRGYEGPATFCDREEETATLINAIDNRQDITLYAYRRLGKSALIHHVFHHIKKRYNCVYADLWGTVGLDDFVKELGNAILKSNVFAKKRLGEKVMDFIRSIGASISVGIDGMPSIDIIYHDRNKIFNNLEEIFTFLDKLPSPVVLAIDEFQEIRKYEETVLEAKLRALSQQCKNIRFIFSGSELHMLHKLFNDYSRPFYQSTRMIALPKIAAEKYELFIIRQFKKGKKTIDPEIVRHILDITYRHTYYVQAICNYLYSLENTPKTIAGYETAYYGFLQEKKVFYSELPQLLTPRQFRCVKAFARHGLVKSPTSGSFLQDSGVMVASSMQRIIKALLEKQVILKEDDGYRLYDVFLEHYLKYVV